jgi:sugar phosphate isomerase/epimerase
VPEEMKDSVHTATTLFPDSRLILSAGTLPYAGFADRVHAAKTAGFDAISLFPQQYLRARRREKLGIADMQEILQSHCIALDEVDPLLDWFGPDASGSEQLMYEMAEAFGARSMNAAPAFCPHGDLSQVTAAFSRLSERAARHGLRVDLEFLPWTLVSDLDKALTVVRDAGQANTGVMLDCWHFFRSRCEVEQISALGVEDIDRITSVQVNDAPARPARPGRRQKFSVNRTMITSAVDGLRVMGPGRFLKVAGGARNPHPNASQLMAEASCFRLLPGEGDIPLHDLLKALASAGCKPTIGLEIFSLELNKLPAEEAARRAMAAYRSLEE